MPPILSTGEQALVYNNTSPSSFNLPKRRVTYSTGVLVGSRLINGVHLTCWFFILSHLFLVGVSFQRKFIHKFLT